MGNVNTQQDNVRPINPTLLVGLGGTGREIITRIRRNFVQKYGSVSNFPIVGYFLIDTDQTMQHYTSGLRNLQVNFSQNEVFDAIIPNISSYTQNPHAHPEIAEWIYTNLSELGDMRTGAAAIRPYGRLAFFVHHDRIKTNLTDALNSLRSPDKTSFVANKYNIKCGTGLSVYIICSIAGGTGSAMFLDTAFAIKEIGKIGGFNIEVTGFLVMPNLFGIKDKNYANGYAALKELEHYNRVNNFEVRYGNEDRKSFPPPPFDYCYLINNENEANVSVSFNERENLFELISENIFLDFSDDDFANHKRRIRVNFADQLSGTYNPGSVGSELGSQGNWGKNYMSLGFTSIYYPADRIISCCAYKMAGNIFEYWGKLSDLQANVVESSMDDFVYNPSSGNRGLMADVGIYESQGDSGKHDILTQITRLRAGQDMVRDIQNYANTLIQDANNDLHEQQKQSLVDFLNDRLRLYEAKFVDKNQEPDPNRRGSHDRQMDGNIDVFLYGGNLAGSDEYIDGLLDRASEDGNIIRGSLYKYVSKMINNRTLSSAHMIEALQAVKNRIEYGEGSYISILKNQLDEQSETGLYRKLKECYDRIEEFKREINTLLSERQEHYEWSNILPWDKMKRKEAIRYDNQKISRKLEGYRDAFVAYFHTKLRIASRHKALDVYKKIIDYIDEDLIPEIRRIDATVRSLTSLAYQASEIFRGKIEVSLFQNIYDPEDIENIYYPKGRKINDLDYHSNEIIKKLSSMSPEQTDITIVDLPELADRFSAEGILNTVVSYTREVFDANIRNLNIIEEVYEKKYPEDSEGRRKLFIGNTLNFGKCWVSLASDLPNFRFEPNNQKSLIVGYRTDLSKQHIYDLFRREVNDSRNTQIDPNIQFFQTSDASKVIISTEIAGFPLCAFSGIKFMKEKYDALYIKNDHESALHIEKNDYKFRDILPMITSAEIERYNNVRYCFVMGVILGVLKPNPDEKYIFKREIGIREIHENLDVKKKAILTMEKNPELLEEIKKNIMLIEGKILRMRNGKYDPEIFRNYYLTINWYSERIYPPPNYSDEKKTSSEDMEHKILVKKLSDLEEMYKQSWRRDEADMQWEQFKMEAISVSNNPDVYSEEINGTRFRVVKIQNG